MVKKFVLIVIALVLMLGLASSVAASSDATFFVSPNGDDTWSGQLAAPNYDRSDGPFATFVRARNAIRQGKDSGELIGVTVTVQARGGTYYISEPITFTPQDSGTEEHPISYVAYPGEEPVLCGGRRIEGLQPAGGGIYSVFLPEVENGEWYFRQLFVDSERQIRARYPNFDYSDPCRKGFMYVHRGIGDFGVQVHGIHSPGDWLEYKANIPADGEYRFWMFYGCPYDMSGRTALSVDGGEAIPLLNLSAGDKWTSKWSDNECAMVYLTHGECLLKWQNVEGKAIGFDAFVLTDDPDWEPDGTNIPDPAVGKYLILFQAEDYEQGYRRVVSVKRIAFSEGSSRTMFRYEQGTFNPAWAEAPDAEMHIFIGGGSGELSSIVAIENVEEETCTVTVEQGGRELKRGDRYFVENVFEELDSPGEWYLNKQTGYLYYWPKQGFSEESEVIAPVAQVIFRVEGGVGHIRIAGLTIKGTAYDLNSPIYQPYGIVTEGVVSIGEATNCTIENCTFRNIGGWAVVCNGGGSHVISGNEISDGAQGGVHLMNSSQNTILNNHIHDLGRVCKHIGGVTMYGDAAYDEPADSGSTTENVISHNLIHDIPRYGISDKFTGGQNVIEYNRILRTCTETYDAGGIEASTAIRTCNEEYESGTVIRYNIVGDTIGYSSVGGIDVFRGCGICLDGYASGYTITNNIVYRSGPFALAFTAGKYNTIENNIFVDGNIVFANINDNSDELVLERNIFCCTQMGRERPEGLAMWRGIIEAWRRLCDKENGLVSDYNLYFIHGGDEYLAFTTDSFGSVSFAGWQTHGFDTHSTVADPLFMDPDNDDYSLQPGSPAFELGFEEIDTTRIGLLPHQISGYWKFDEGEGTTAADSSGNANDGTLYLGTSGNTDPANAWVDGKIGKALEFDGVDDYVDCGNNASLDITDEITIEAWVKPTANVGVDNVIYFGYDYYARKGISFDMYSNTIRLRLGNGTDRGYATSAAFALNTWHHVAGTWDGDTMQMYVDGVASGSSSSFTGPILFNGALRYIGRDASRACFNGVMDEVKIYSRALSDEEIQQEYSSNVKVGEWKFDDGAGGTARDTSGNGFDGMLTNMNTNTCWTNGASGGALKFDGFNDYVNCGDDLKFKGMPELTVEAWVKGNSYKIYAGVLSKWSWNSQQHYLLGYFQNGSSSKLGKFSFGVSQQLTTGASDSLQSQTNLDLNTWYHIAGVFKGGQYIKLYVNGVLNTNKATTVTRIANGALPTSIGQYAPYAFDGLIDEVRVYAKALSATEIQQDYLADMAGGMKGFSGSVNNDSGSPIQAAEETPGSNSMADDALPAGTLANQDAYSVFAADLDGDKLADPVIYCRTNGDWEVKLSGSDYAPVYLGAYLGGAGYTALAADFDGDAKADPAVYQVATGNWQVKFSSTDYALTTLDGFLGGTNYTVALAGDFDGDQLADPCVYQAETGTWIFRFSSLDYLTVPENSLLGGTGYAAVAGDFDGDAKADPAVYCDSIGFWGVLLSADGYMPALLDPKFGGDDWTAVAADFDGDNYAEPAVYSPSTAEWLIRSLSLDYVPAVPAFSPF